jgi:AcrR family transcriptional regulator
MERLPTARSDAERNRRTMLDAAAGVLARNPDASLLEVAHLAGLTRATLYRHFGSREGLLAALLDDALECAREAVTAARVDEGTALESLRRVIATILSFGNRFRPLLTDGAEQDPVFLRQRMEAFSPVVSVIERGQRSGVFRTDVSRQWAVTALIALLAAAVREAEALPDVDLSQAVFLTITRGLVEP